MLASCMAKPIDGQFVINKEKCEDTKGIIRGHKWKEYTQWSNEKDIQTTMIYKTLHRKLKTQRHESTKKL